jgi:hypothetical protein
MDGSAPARPTAFTDTRTPCGALRRGSIRQVQWSSFGLYMRSRRGWIGVLDQHTHVAQQQIVLEYIAVEEAPGQSLESLRVHDVHLRPAEHLFADSRSQIHSVRKLQRGIPGTDVDRNPRRGSSQELLVLIEDGVIDIGVLP